MTTTAIILNILFILCLTSTVVPHSLGLLKSDDKPVQQWLIPMMFGISQGLAVFIGSSLGRLFAHLIEYVAEYLVFAMMLVVSVKMFIDSMRILKGKMLYTVSKDSDIILLSIMAAMNTLLMSLLGPYFMPFDYWFILLVTLAGFLWAFFTVRVDFTPGIIKKASFIEFSAAVFMVIIAILYLFTDLMK